MKHKVIGIIGVLLIVLGVALIILQLMAREKGSSVIHSIARGATPITMGTLLIGVSRMLERKKASGGATAPVAPVAVVHGDVTRFGDSKFYIRMTGGSDITGTFTASEIISKLTTGQLHGTDAAVEAVGQTLGKLKRMREDEWTPLNKMFEIHESAA